MASKLTAIKAQEVCNQEPTLEEVGKRDKGIFRMALNIKEAKVFQRIWHTDGGCNIRKSTSSEPNLSVYYSTEIG